MASKSKSKGSSKKAPPASKLRKAVAQKPKPKVKAVAAKTVAKTKAVAAKPAPKPPAKKAKAVSKPVKAAAKPIKPAPKKVQKSSRPAKTVTKALKKGTSIQPTKVLKPIQAKAIAKKATPKPTSKVPNRASPAVQTKKATATIQPVLIKDAKKALAPKSALPLANVAVVPTKAIAKNPPKPVPSLQEKPKKPVTGSKAEVPVEKDSRKPKLELFKGPFFQEVPVGSAAVRKSRAPQVPVVTLRKPKGEESHDELIARIEKELLTVRMAGKKIHRVQVCTKCCINPVDPSFMVDRDTGYCTECAVVLGLGHTREARQQNFHPSLMKSEEVVVPE